MVIGIFGESCTGKSTIAEELSQRAGATVYTGKDYTRLAKNEEEAKQQFSRLLKDNEQTEEYIVYVVSEKEHLALLPEGSVRVLVTAELDVIKERFAQRMKGVLPPPVAAMLEKRHGSFDDEPCDMRVDNADGGVSEICDRLIAQCLTRRRPV